MYSYLWNLILLYPLNCVWYVFDCGWCEMSVSPRLDPCPFLKWFLSVGRKFAFLAAASASSLERAPRSLDAEQGLFSRQRCKSTPGRAPHWSDWLPPDRLSIFAPKNCWLMQLFYLSGPNVWVHLPYIAKRKLLYLSFLNN